MTIPTDTVDPRTPAEAKRHWMIDRLWVVCLFCFVALSFLIGIVWLGAWPTALAEQRLTILGWLSGGLLTTMAIIVVAFTLGGPVGRWEARWGNRKLLAEDDDQRGRDAYDGAVK